MYTVFIIIVYLILEKSTINSYLNRELELNRIPILIPEYFFTITIQRIDK